MVLKRGWRMGWRTASMAMNLSILLPWLLSGEFSPGNRILMLKTLNSSLPQYMKKRSMTSALASSSAQRTFAHLITEVKY